MAHMIKILIGVVAVVFGLTVAASGPAAASPDQDVFDDHNNAWACETEANLPPHHCINVNSGGNTGVVKVFEPDPRWPVESISEDPRSDSRPCPHDPDSPDGTWWSPLPGLWVCHHRP